MRLAFAPYELHFREPAGTSRGVMLTKPTCFIKVWEESHPEVYGIGEAAYFPGLSPEANSTYEFKMIELLANVAIGRQTDLSAHSSIQFGLEQALLDFSSGGQGLYFPSPFTNGEQSIEINGLVWMGDFETMMQRLERKIQEGFKCVKIKIGAIEWQRELDMVKWIRNRYSPEELTIRVDANGGFSMDTALARLQQLADLGVHSIEQPIPARNEELMATLCQVSPLPIALDEELIGVYGEERKAALLDLIKPAYIILKPALCGGFSGAQEWIDLAQERGIGWWVTSALESNVGLTALAQWTARKNPTIPQGLGTGALFTDNTPSRLQLIGDQLHYCPNLPLDKSFFDNLPWRE